MPLTDEGQGKAITAWERRMREQIENHMDLSTVPPPQCKTLLVQINTCLSMSVNS